MVFAEIAEHIAQQLLELEQMAPSLPPELAHLMAEALGHQQRLLQSFASA